MIWNLVTVFRILIWLYLQEDLNPDLLIYTAVRKFRILTTIMTEKLSDVSYESIDVVIDKF
jgi:hypothetical protein